MKYKNVKKKWCNCQRCSLKHKRRNVVLVRGDLPCEILFIGEAPGFEEDTVGYPFVGPAGHLLDMIVETAFEEFEQKPRIAFTNIISCIPLREEERKKIEEPELSWVENCRERFLDVFNLCKPKKIVTVGKFAENNLPAKLITNHKLEKENINHPAYILRLSSQQKNYAILRNIEILKNFVN
jgi:DNA polymerase